MWITVVCCCQKAVHMAYVNIFFLQLCYWHSCGNSCDLVLFQQKNGLHSSLIAVSLSDGVELCWAWWIWLQINSPLHQVQCFGTGGVHLPCLMFVFLPALLCLFYTFYLLSTFPLFIHSTQPLLSLSVFTFALPLFDLVHSCKPFSFLTNAFLTDCSALVWWCWVVLSMVDLVALADHMTHIVLHCLAICAAFVGLWYEVCES